MLLLTSVNDRLEIVTSAAATIDVHASWVDTTSLPPPAVAITPGRTNTAISLATTTSVAGAPAASTQRNVKTLHVRNRHASLSCDITVQHNNGTVTVQLYKVALGAGDMLEYTDQGGFGGGRIPAPVVAVVSIPKIVKFTASGTYTPTVGMTYCMIECVGGGGGGGATTGASTNQFMTAGGGGAGGYSRSMLTAATIGVGQTVTIGAGGNGGAAGANNGANGGDTSFGALCIAKSGSGAPFTNNGGTASGIAGAGGIAGTGDFTATGAPGNRGYLSLAIVQSPSSEGGSSIFGGGAVSSYTANSAIPGGNASNYGSGGGGGASMNNATNAAGGNGSPGICIVTEFFN